LTSGPSAATWPLPASPPWLRYWDVSILCPWVAWVAWVGHLAPWLDLEVDLGRDLGQDLDLEVELLHDLRLSH
jgi:hypothetical protein